MRHGFNLKIPPLAVVVVMAILMWASALAAPTLALDIPGREVIALLLAGGGVAISISGVVSFRRAGTTVNPLKPEASSSLVSTGVYSVSRNPMYLGFLMLLLGWAMYDRTHLRSRLFLRSSCT